MGGVNVLVLAAGLGTRLRELAARTPKALVPIGAKPALHHVLTHLERSRLDVAVVNAHHHADQIAAFVRASFPRWSISHEEELLGTAGALHRVRGHHGTSDYLVWNADVLSTFEPAALFRSSAAATLAVEPAQERSGNVGLDRDGCVVRLRTETFRNGEVGAANFTGIHRVGSALSVPERGCLVTDVYMPALRNGSVIDVVHVKERVFEFGTPESYEACNRDWSC